MKKFCKKCQAETERNAYGKCFPCRRAIALKWRNSNIEMAREITAKWTAENRVAANAAVTAWANANKDRVKANNAARYIRNRDSIAATHAAYRKENRDKISARNSDYHKANPDKARANWVNRRARKRSSEGSHTAHDIAHLFTLQRGKCACCNVSIKAKYHVDHVIPLVAGGRNDRLNLQLLCPTCNLSKSAKNPIDFMQQRGYLL